VDGDFGWMFSITHWPLLNVDPSWVLSERNEGVSVLGSIRQYISLAAAGQRITDAEELIALHGSLRVAVIEGRPRSAIHETRFGWIWQSEDPHAYSRGRAHWLKHVAANDADPVIALHASKYFWLSDPGLCSQI